LPDPLRRRTAEPDHGRGHPGPRRPPHSHCHRRRLRSRRLHPDEARGAVVRGATLTDQTTRTTAAIEVADVSKSFLLPHQRRTTPKEHFLHPFDRTTYEQQKALQHVSFAVREGEFFGIIGPNGSGKSTLLKIIAAIYREDAGEVRVRGRLSPFIELGVGFNME